MTPVRILVTGCRRWACHELADAIMARLLARYGPNLVLVQGGATGVDQAFAEAARELGLAVETHEADWEEHGKRAGPIRNAAMVAAGAEICVAVHRDLRGSRGTLDCVKQALAAGIPVALIDNDEGKARWVTKWKLR